MTTEDDLEILPPASMDENSRRKYEVAKWLKMKFIDHQRYCASHGMRMPSLASWAVDVIHIAPPSVSHYINQRRLPTGRSLDKIASALGPEIYDLLGLDRKVPTNDPLFKAFAALWPKMTKKDKRDMLKHAEELAALAEREQQQDELFSPGGQAA